MFSSHYDIACEEVSELSHRRRAPLDSLRPTVASDYAPFFWSEGFGLGASWIVPSSPVPPKSKRAFTRDESS
jgi:hypothetical protein